MTTTATRTAPTLEDFPAVTGDFVTEGHARVCRERGHATYVRDGVDQGFCPRCGDVTTPAAEQIAMVNGHMLGATTEPGEYVDWSAPDVMPADEWRELLGVDVATYAGENPHMIVWQA